MKNIRRKPLYMNLQVISLKLQAKHIKVLYFQLLILNVFAQSS